MHVFQNELRLEFSQSTLTSIERQARQKRLLFCGKEFVSLGRFYWRCKSKVKYNREPTANVNPVMEMPAQECAFSHVLKSYRKPCLTHYTQEKSAETFEFVLGDI